MSGRRARDRVLIGWLVAAALVLLIAVGLTAWLNAGTPLAPVPVTSSARA